MWNLLLHTTRGQPILYIAIHVLQQITFSLGQTLFISFLKAPYLNHSFCSPYNKSYSTFFA